MKRKKVALKTDSKKTVKEGADTGNRSSKELKLSQASEGCSIRDLPSQGKTSNSVPKVKLEKLGVKIKKNVDTSVPMRRGRSRSDVDATHLDNLRTRAGVRRKMDHNESKLIAGQILNDLIESNLKRSKKRSRAEQGGAQTRRGRSEEGADLSIMDCVAQLDNLKRKRGRRPGISKNTESRHIAKDIVCQLIESSINLSLVNQVEAENEGDRGSGDISTDFKSFAQTEQIENTLGKMERKEQECVNEECGNFEIPPAKKIKLFKHQENEENLPVSQGEFETSRNDGKESNIEEIFLEEGELENSDDESDSLKLRTKCDDSNEEKSEELISKTELISSPSPFSDIELKDQGKEIEILDPIKEIFDRTLRVTTRVNITSKNFDNLFLQSENIENIYFGNFFFVKSANFKNVKKILKKRGFTYTNYQAISNDLPDSAPKFYQKNSIRFVSSKKNISYDMLKELKSSMPSWSVHFTFSRSCYILCKSVETAKKMRSNLSKISGASENILKCSKLTHPYLSYHQVAKILKEEPEVSKTLALVWKRKCKHERSENW